MDTEFPIVWAWADTPYVSFHGNDHGTTTVTLPSTGGCVIGAVVPSTATYPKATLHGVLMWFAWTIVALCQIVTNRYMKHYWRYRQLIHTLLGVLSGAVTLAGIIIVLKWLGWAFYFDHWHNVAGMLFMVLCEFLVLGGVSALVMKRYANFDWRTKTMLQRTSVHKYFGYFMIIAV